MYIYFHSLIDFQIVILQTNILINVCNQYHNETYTSSTGWSVIFLIIQLIYFVATM